jgi:hypothetical protein
MSTFMEHIHREETPLFDADALHLWTPVEFAPDDYPHLDDAYRHEDGSITYVCTQLDSEHANPREDDCNLTTLIQRNDHCIAVDTDHLLNDAAERWWHDDPRMKRYIAMFRPDIVHYESHWSAGDSYGWGYITLEAWQENMFPAPPGKDATPDAVEHFLSYVPTITPQEVFDAEVKVYGQWCNGEVYYAINVHPDGTEESCGGFLGYDDHKDIADQVAGSPVTETLY